MIPPNSYWDWGAWGGEFALNRMITSRCGFLRLEGVKRDKGCQVVYYASGTVRIGVPLQSRDG